MSTPQSKRKPLQHENCVTVEKQSQSMSAKAALKKVKDFEAAHKFEVEIVDRKTIKYKLIR